MSDSAARTVVGVDGSDESTAAVRWAARRAAVTGDALRLVHAYTAAVMFPAAPFASGVSPRTQEAYARAAESVLASAADTAWAAAPGVDVTTEAVVGGAAQALVAASDGARLVVVGSRGHGGFAGLLLGSVGAQVSAHARCPTAVLRGGAPPADGPIVVGVDGSTPSNAALRFAVAEAGRLGVDVVAVHAWSLPQSPGLGEAFAAELAAEQDPGAYEAAARQVLDEAAAPWRAAAPDVELRADLVPAAGPATALLTAAKGASMVVVGSRGHGGFVGLLLGSTSQSVVHHAPCPVVVIRADAEPTG